jgi:hypothetical protein
MSATELGLFIGQGLGNALCLVDNGITDNGVRYEVVATSDPITPDGEGGESVFCGLWITVTHTMGCRLKITPYVDGLAKPVTYWELVNLGERRIETREVPINDVLYDSIDPSHELARFFARGRRMSVRVEVEVLEFGSVWVAGVGGGDLIIESIELETDKVQESQETVSA